MLGDDDAATGISALYAALADTLTRHALDALAIVVTDPVLGEQLFVVGHAPSVLFSLDPGSSTPSSASSWRSAPALETEPPELDALRALARTTLRLGAVDPAADAGTRFEVSIRSVPDVLAITRDGPVLKVLTRTDSRDGVVARLAALAESGPDPVILVETLDDPAPPEATPAPGTRVELVAVRTEPETGELEVHVGYGSRRTVGRGPINRAGGAAAEATLAALAELGHVTDARVAWARTIDTMPDRQFLVAVALTRAGATTLYGLAPGASPIEAAARATLDACNRQIGSDRTEA